MVEIRILTWKLSPQENRLLSERTPGVSIVELGTLAGSEDLLKSDAAASMLVIPEEEQDSLIAWADATSADDGVLPSPVLVYRRQTNAPINARLIAYCDDVIDATDLMPIVERLYRDDGEEAERAAEDVRASYLRRLPMPIAKIDSADFVFETPELDAQGSHVRRALASSPLFRRTFDERLGERVRFSEQLLSLPSPMMERGSLLLELRLNMGAARAGSSRMLATFVLALQTAMASATTVRMVPNPTTRKTEPDGPVEKDATAIERQIRIGLGLAVGDYSLEIISEGESLTFWQLADLSGRRPPFRLEFVDEGGVTLGSFGSSDDQDGDGERVNLSSDDWTATANAGEPLNFRIVALLQRAR